MMIRDLHQSVELLSSGKFENGGSVVKVVVVVS